MFASTFLLSTLVWTKKLRAATVGAIVALMVVVGSVQYEVRSGDTLSAIAAAHGVTLAQILEVNDISNPDLITIGQQIVIPGSGGKAATIHVVAAGETVGSIAAKYGASANSIAGLNELANVNLIMVGQRLQIPGASGSQGGGDPTGHHVVTRGETLASIAAKYGISVDQLAKANGITNTSVIYVGARLALSGDTYVAEPSGTSTASHTVVSGDTVGTIARSYGVTAADIVAANDLGNVNVIKIGQKLTIPGGSAAWICPVRGASYVNDWGYPRTGGRFHEGNDLFAPRGTEVLAPVSGDLKPISGTVGGLQFHLYGDDGVRYIGTHLEGFGRSGRVEAGQVIGYVGDTGNARGGPTHLHFEMHPGDKGPANPFPTLQKTGC
ncbi:hypothetical protein BH23ACT5_BH23ACT5_02940 [soil metagenome]